MQILLDDVMFSAKIFFMLEIVTKAMMSRIKMIN